MFIPNFLSEILPDPFFAIIILVIVFLICREIVCWYYKINKAISLLEKIADNTKKETKGEEKKADNENK